MSKTIGEVQLFSLLHPKYLYDMTAGILVEGDQLLPVGVGVDIEEGEIHIVVSTVGLMTNGEYCWSYDQR